MSKTKAWFVAAIIMTLAGGFIYCLWSWQIRSYDPSDAIRIWNMRDPSAALGMTEKAPGVTEKGAGMTEKEVSA